MNTTDAVAVLRAHNKWRRAKAGARMPHSARDIGIAIDVLCDEIERLTLALEGYGKRPEECAGADGEGACVSHMAYEALRDRLRKRKTPNAPAQARRRRHVGLMRLLAPQETK